MTEQALKQLLSGLGIQFAYHHWDRPPKMPYGVYFDGYTDNFEADDIAYTVVSHWSIELYARQRDRRLEERLEQLLTDAGLYWDKDAQYIDSERFYQVVYEIEV